MHTLTLPYRTTGPGKEALTWLRRIQSAAVRQAYAQGGVDPKTGKKPTEVKQRAAVNARWSSTGVGSMVLQNAVRAGRALRKARPDGDIVFGGKKNLARRAKVLISNNEWKVLRLRPLELQGNINRGGNAHIVWPDGDPDSSVTRLDLRFPCRVSGAAEGQPATVIEKRIPLDLKLHTLSRKQRVLLSDLFRCARRCDLTLSIRVDDSRIAFTYDPLDLRRLAPGQTLLAARAVDVAACKAKRKGRACINNDKNRAKVVKPYITATGRPVHPDLKAPTLFHPYRKIGIDLNPEWLGVSVLEWNPSLPFDDLDAFRVCDYALIRWDLDHAGIKTRECLAQAIAVATQRIISLARSWNVGEIAMEEGLGFLRTQYRGRVCNRKNNTWARSKFRGPLEHRAALSGITVRRISAAYTTTIGNVGFGALWDALHPARSEGLPDACASAAEIARRAFVPDEVLRTARTHEGASDQDNKSDAKNQNQKNMPLRDCKTQELSAALQAWLPRFDPHLLSHDRWKETVAGSSNWVEAHGKLKTAEGFRRPHASGWTPAQSRTVDARPALPGHEVVALGYATRPGWWIRPAMIDRRRAWQEPGVVKQCQQTL